MALPFADRGDVDLARHGDELVVTVGSYRRLLALPAALRRAKVVGAGMRDGALVVRFDTAGDGEPLPEVAEAAVADVDGSDDDRDRATELPSARMHKHEY